MPPMVWLLHMREKAVLTYEEEVMLHTAAKRCESIEGGQISCCEPCSNTGISPPLLLLILAYAIHQFLKGGNRWCYEQVGVL